MSGFILDTPNLQYRKENKSSLHNKPHRRYPYSDVVVGFAWSRVPESYVGGSAATGRPSQTGQVKGILSSSILGVGFGADDSFSEKTLLSRNLKEEVKSHPGVEEKKKKKKKR